MSVTNGATDTVVSLASQMELVTYKGMWSLIFFSGGLSGLLHLFFSVYTTLYETHTSSKSTPKW